MLTITMLSCVDYGSNKTVVATGGAPEIVFSILMLSKN